MKLPQRDIIVTDIISANGYDLMLPYMGRRLAFLRIYIFVSCEREYMFFGCVRDYKIGIVQTHL
jgi:hypothetical protein